MTFLYKIEDTDDTSSQIRLEIGDTQEDSGPRPDGTNFTDEEIDYAYDQEGSLEGAAARLLEMLARAWSREASFAEGPLRIDRAQIAKSYADQAAVLRTRAGIGTLTVSEPTRVDGYSDDIGSWEE